jgi:hypothetical protein
MAANIPLITSISPRISRCNDKGDDIGETYQLTCIESWRRAGFEPVSVNSTNEAYSHSVRMIPVRRDASAITGRAHVFLADLLAVASIEARGRPFVVMNADLIVPPTTTLADRLGQMRPGEFIFSRRIDIDQPYQTDGVAPRWGYDFFAGHADDISKLSDAGMVFGAPWWDYFFPLLMFMQGCRTHLIEPAVLHLNHTERWTWAAWEKLGQRFVAEVGARATDKTFRLRLEDAVKGRTGRPFWDMTYNILKRLPMIAAGEPRRMLHRVAVASIAFLDEMSLTQGSSRNSSTDPRSPPAETLASQSSKYN